MSGTSIASKAITPGIVYAAGKSTLFRLISGLAKPPSGVIRLHDTDLASLPSRTRLTRICFMPQFCATNAALTVFDVVRMAHKQPRSWRFSNADNGHNAASKRGMISEGTAPWNGAIDTETTVVFDVPGIHGYICLPHYEMGMGRQVLVGGDLSNLAAVKKLRHHCAARKAFRRLLKQLEA